MNPRRLASDTSFSMTSGCAETLAMMRPKKERSGWFDDQMGRSSNLSLLVPYRFDGIQPPGLHRRIQRRQRGNGHAGDDRHNDVEARGGDRQVIDRVDLSVEL